MNGATCRAHLWRGAGAAAARALKCNSAPPSLMHAAAATERVPTDVTMQGASGGQQVGERMRWGMLHLPPATADRLSASKHLGSPAGLSAALPGGGVAASCRA